MSSLPQTAQLSKYLKLCKLIIRLSTSCLLLYKQREGGERGSDPRVGERHAHTRCWHEWLLSEQAAPTPEQLIINYLLPPHEQVSERERERKKGGERGGDFTSLTAGTESVRQSHVAPASRRADYLDFIEKHKKPRPLFIFSFWELEKFTGLKLWNGALLEDLNLTH